MRRLFVLLALAVPLSAQQPIVIEGIEVQHPSGIPDRIIVSESRLTPGRSYTEEEITQATYRVRRLPFVFRASYRLEQGSSPGAQKLVFIITPLKRFNMTFDLGYERREDFDFITFVPNFGHRTFAGTSVFEIAAGATTISDSEGDFRSLVFQYSVYDLLGTGTVVQAAVAESFSSGNTRRDPSPTIRIAVPLTRLQSIVANYSSFGEENDFLLGIDRVPVTSSFEQRRAEIFWTRDTTDDPFFTLRGTSLSAGPRLLDFDGRSPRVTGRPPVVDHIEREERHRGVAFIGNHFIPFGSQWTVRGSMDAYAGRMTNRSPFIDREGDITNAQWLLTAARNAGPFFDESEDYGIPGRHRLEAGLAYRIDRSRFDEEWESTNQLGATASYLYRHPRWLFRISAIYYGL